MSRSGHAAVPYLAIEGFVTSADVGGIRKRVRAFGIDHGASAAALAAIVLAVSEAVANAVVHGYDSAGGELRVEVDVEENELEVVVADCGRGFTSAPTRGLGLGLGLMRESAAAFEIRDQPSGGVEVWMRFPLDSAA